jgi:protein phosphatase
MRFSLGNAQHIGDRSEQQDSFGFSDPDDSALAAHAGVAAVVADGMGGLANGAAASSAAVQAFLKAYAAKRPEESIPDALLRSIRAANQAVLTIWHRNGDRESLGSTLAAVALHENWLYWVSAGDSRVYILRAGQITRLTNDHNYAADLEVQVGRGRISREEASHHPDREALTSYLGLENLPHIDRSVRAFAVEPGDCVLICSDGLYRALSEQEIAAALEKDARRTCETLVERALAKHVTGQDNITTMALRCREDSGSVLPIPKLLLAAAAAAAFAVGGFVFWRQSAPTIRNFSVDRGRIQAGESAQLRWSVDKGRVTITPDIGELVQHDGTRSVTPARRMSYTLEARNVFWSERRTVDIDVVTPPKPQPLVAAAKPPAETALPPAPPPPPADIANTSTPNGPTIVSFTASPDHVAPGKPAVLKWNVRNATVVHLDPAGGGASLQGQGHKSVNPTATATYTLTATARGKTVTQQVVVNVGAPKPAVQIDFNSDKPTIKRGESATLKWNVSGAQSVSIDNGIGAVKNADTRKVVPTAKTTYRLTATEPGGAKITNAVTIDIAASKPDSQAPKIVAFEIVPDGENMKFRWQITAADPSASKVTIEPGIGTVPFTCPDDGLQLPSPLADHYTLTVTAPGVNPVTKDAAVPPRQAAIR